MWFSVWFLATQSKVSSAFTHWLILFSGNVFGYWFISTWRCWLKQAHLEQRKDQPSVLIEEIFFKDHWPFPICSRISSHFYFWILYLQHNLTNISSFNEIKKAWWRIWGSWHIKNQYWKGNDFKSAAVSLMPCVTKSNQMKCVSFNQGISTD